VDDHVDAALCRIAGRRQRASRDPDRRAWLRLFGVVPFDYDRLMIAELHPGRGFREESTMLSRSQWRRDRSVTAKGIGKTIVCDRITFQLRAFLHPLTPIVAKALRALFDHRHRRLRRHFVANASASRD
jgi:hypothetical protein